MNEPSSDWVNVPFESVVNVQSSCSVNANTVSGERMFSASAILATKWRNHCSVSPPEIGLISVASIT